MPVVLAALLLLLVAPVAEARWYAAERISGQGASPPVVDLGVEAGGGVAYVLGGRAWLSRLGSRGWTDPAPLSAGGTTEAAVAAGPRGRLAAAWIQHGEVVGGGTVLSSGGGASGLSMEMGVNGVAYAVWAQNGDIRAARHRGATWTPVPLPLDVDPAQSAAEPNVAVAADGSALVVWTEAGHVFARRIYGTTLSALPQDAGAGDSPEVDIEYDRSYAWVAFRQGGHSYARRLRASTFERPYALDRGIDSGGPDVSMSSSGAGHGVSVTATGWLVGAPLRDDRFHVAGRLDRTGGVTAAVLASSERDDSAVAWLARGVVRGRLLPESGRPGRAAAIGTRATGPLSASANRIGDTAVAFLSAGSVGVAMYDLPPSAPTLRDIPSVVGRSVLVRWLPGNEFGGSQRFRVEVDGRRVATTGATSRRVRLSPGRHRISVVGVDHRGQRSSRARPQTVFVR